MDLPIHEPDNDPFLPRRPADDLPAGVGFETLCTHAAEASQILGGPAAVPIYQASTFLFPDAEAFEKRKAPGSPYFEYTRVGNPTTAVLEAKLALLEKAQWCFCLSSGMAAISAAINACVHAGAHVVCVERCYWPTARYLRNYLPRFGVTTTFVNSVSAADYIAAIRPETKLIYLESPTSGTMEILDVESITAEARRRGIPVAFDNSWASPFFQTPLDLGCDLVVHSATKYIGGHSDVVAGVVCGRDEQLRRRVFREVELIGGTIDPFASWLLIRGLRTLGVRLRQHERSALAVARLLAGHPKVRCVRHPGLESAPGHELARRQMRGFGGLFSFELHDQSRDATHAFIDKLRLFSIGVSWGGHESLVLGGNFWSQDAQMPAWMIRLYVGLETTEDLVEDVRQALG